MRWLVLFLALVSGAMPAEAQMLPDDQSMVVSQRYQSVHERQLTGYSTPGIPVAGFEVRPSINADAIYNDNALALEGDGTGDELVRFTPSVAANSNWSNSLLSLSAAANIDRYATLRTEDTENLNASIYGWHNLARSTRIRAIGRFQTLRESRESQDVFVLTRRPVRFSNATVGIGLSHRLANAILQLEGDVSQTNYDDAVLRETGAPVDQDFRDSLLKRVRGRAEFGQSPAIAYFIQGTYDTRDYRLSDSNPLARARGSDIIEVLAGTRFELPILARGEIGVGYTRGSYSGAQFNTFSGLAIRSDVTFFPTQLTNVVVTADRRVSDTGIPNSGGYASLGGGVRVDHELLRPLLLSASARFQRDSFNGVDRDDNRLELGASADYRVNANLSARISINRLDLSSRGSDAYKSFVANRFLIGIGLRR